MAGPVEGTFQAAVVDVAPATASPEAVLGRGVSDLQAPAMVTATSSRTRPGSRRAGVIVGDLRSLNVLGRQVNLPSVYRTLRTGGSGRMSIEIRRRCGLLSDI